ncbi:hypothetical protein GGP55_002643 [Salinibacter ruber]|jgi:hypothetical protein|uniref:hypothetical protein n=1 Tax=Salinibacter ruber TaxID=146919 RepID=UPI00216A44ED|nr:hypothetical protein [Salinibacter ruber]MCS3632030.1 hypothetical protein [Salinibacter ruber]
MVEFTVEKDLRAEFEDGSVRKATFRLSEGFHKPAQWEDWSVDEKWDFLDEEYVRFHGGLFEPRDCLEDGCERIAEFDDRNHADIVFDEICEMILKDIGEM